MVKPIPQKLQALVIGTGLVGTALVAQWVPLPYKDLVIPMSLIFGIWGLHFGLSRLGEWCHSGKTPSTQDDGRGAANAEKDR